MKRKLSILFSMVLVFSLFFSNNMIAKASTTDDNNSDSYKSAMLQVVDYMNTHASKFDSTETKTYVIPLKDGTTAYSTVSIEDVTPTLARSTSYESNPAELGHTYTWTWTVTLDAALGGNAVIKVNYTVSSSSAYTITGNYTTINVSPPQGYQFLNSNMYFISSSPEISATGYSSCKAPVYEIYINQYYDVSMYGTPGYVNVSYSTYFL